MAQKDKVKELVGRGLGSYHTKSLQQMDRIEKKNKEQSHKISILSNELDNDYLTKTEEGSVISLEHSKEGMIYLDELQGNTLVNYCTDGSKEMTLNGDIDVEGTFVTTTEGMDNGRVDVLCEGNTLVALNKNIETLDLNYPFTIGETYTFILEFQSNANCYCIIEETQTWKEIVGKQPVVQGFNRIITKGIVPNGYIGNMVTLSNRNSSNKYDSSINFTNRKFTILKGDYTNYNLDFFKGMKSVGQDYENGHKIEILSNNKNILSPVKGKKHPFFIKKGTKLVLSEKNNTPSLGGNVKLIDINENVQWFAIDAGVTTQRTITTNNDIYYIENALGGNLEYQVEIGTTRTSYIPYAMNKKEILLNEPLRGLPNGIKDRFVKIGGKFYIERNCVAITLNETYNWAFNNTDGTTTNRYILDLRPILPTLSDGQDIRNTLCDKCVTSQWSQTLELGVSRTGNTLFAYNKSCATLAEFKNWIANNNLNLIMKLAAPIYEPLEIEPTLNTYNDMTHISNNSIIPCNMKVKNSGYNAIIKPSTLYTVALDTNKNGTVGMNLGGAKATTTNNATTITTPATLSDDNLRLYGKGIKGSKVRLLEGDKTNWIPSHFEGIKSSFEDKFDTTDNTYKMEILSNNQNLIKEIKAYSETNAHSYVVEGNTITLTSLKEHQGYIYTGFNFGGKLKPNTTYYISSNIIKSNPNTQPCIRMYDTKKVKDYAFLKQTGSIRFTTPSTEVDNIKMLLYSSIDNVSINNGDTIIYENIQISEVDTNYVEPKFNKIQFSSIEPLRGIDSVKDKFVFKDGKLMIERNVGTYKFLNASSFAIWRNDLPNTVAFRSSNMVLGGKKCKRLGKSRCNILQTANGSNTYYGERGMQILYPNVGTGDSVCIALFKNELTTYDYNGLDKWMKENTPTFIFELEEPYYEEIPHELSKIILEGYENGTLFFDTNIPPTSTVTYAGETPIVKATKLNKAEVLNNTNDINDNIVPYLMDMDYRVVCLQLQSETSGLNMARLFGGAYEMLQRDIQSKRYSIDEYKHRLDAYLGANKITEEEYNKLGDMLNE